MLKSPVKPSTLCLVGIGLFDLVVTIALMGQGLGEGNPLFRWLLQFGPWAFVIGKALLLAIPVLVLEFARKSHPESAEQGTWIAVVAYAAFLGVQLLRIGAIG